MSNPINLTADITTVTADSTYYTADGACLVNGGGTDIIEDVTGKNFNKPSYSISEILPL